MAEREPGWYWVEGLEDEPEPARWNGFGWCVPTEEYVADECDVTKVGPRIYPPGEDLVHDELVAALRDVIENGCLDVHTAHWDAQGNNGRTCPICMRQREVKERLCAALAKADAR